MGDTAFPEIAPLPAVLGMKEVCELIGITQPTARRLVAEGSLPGHRVPNGRLWVFRTDEVLRAVSSWGSGEEDSAAEKDAPRVAGEETPPTDEQTTGPSPDPLEVWCPAPRRDDLDDEAWRSACIEAWIRAVRAAGLDGEPERRNGLIEFAGNTYEIRVAPREKVLVLDDYGDESWELIDAVWAERS